MKKWTMFTPLLAQRPWQSSRGRISQGQPATSFYTRSKETPINCQGFEGTWVMQTHRDGYDEHE